MIRKLLIARPVKAFNRNYIKANLSTNTITVDLGNDVFATHSKKNILLFIYLFIYYYLL